MTKGFKINGLTVITAMAVLSYITVAICDPNARTGDATTKTATTAKSSSMPTQPAEMLKYISKKYEPKIKLKLDGDSLKDTLRLISEQAEEHGLAIRFESGEEELLQNISVSQDFDDEPFWSVVGTLVKEHNLGVELWHFSSHKIFAPTLGKPKTHDNTYLSAPGIFFILGWNNEPGNNQKSDTEANGQADNKGPYAYGMRLQLCCDPRVISTETFSKATVMEISQKKKLNAEASLHNEIKISGKTLAPGQTITIDMELEVLCEKHDVVIPAKEGKYDDKKSGYKFTVTAPKYYSDGRTQYSCDAEPGDSSEKYSLIWNGCIDENDAPLEDRGGSMGSGGSGSFNTSITYSTKGVDTDKLRLAFTIGKYKTIPYSITMNVGGQPTSAPASSPASAPTSAPAKGK